MNFAVVLALAGLSSPSFAIREATDHWLRSTPWHRLVAFRLVGSADAEVSTRCEAIAMPVCHIGYIRHEIRRSERGQNYWLPTWGGPKAKIPLGARNPFVQLPDRYPPAVPFEYRPR